MEKLNKWIELPHQNDRIVAQIAIDDQPFMASLDTGSTRSLISIEKANKIGTNENRRRIEATITLADGSKTSVTQALEVVVRLGQSRAKMLMLVLPDVIDNIVLGLDFMRETSSVLEVGDLRIPLGTLPEFNIWQTGSLLSLHSNMLTKDDGCIDVMCQTKVTKKLNDDLSEAENLTEEALHISKNALVKTRPIPASTESVSTEPKDDKLKFGKDWVVAPLQWRVKTPERRLPSQLITSILEMTKTKVRRRTRKILIANGYKFSIERNPRRMLVVSFVVKNNNI